MKPSSPMTLSIHQIQNYQLAAMVSGLCFIAAQKLVCWAFSIGLASGRTMQGNAFWSRFSLFGWKQNTVMWEKWQNRNTPANCIERRSYCHVTDKQEWNCATWIPQPIFAPGHACRWIEIWVLYFLPYIIAHTCHSMNDHIVGYDLNKQTWTTNQSFIQTLKE